MDAVPLGRPFWPHYFVIPRSPHLTPTGLLSLFRYIPTIEYQLNRNAKSHLNFLIRRAPEGEKRVKTERRELARNSVAQWSWKLHGSGPASKHLHEMCRVWGGGGGGGPEFRVLDNSSWLAASAAGVGRAGREGEKLALHRCKIWTGFVFMNTGFPTWVLEGRDATKSFAKMLLAKPRQRVSR